MAGPTRPSGRRARASAGRMKGLHAVAIFLPALATAASISGQPVSIPSPVAAKSPSPAPASAVGGPFTVLLLGSDDDEKFDPAHVLTQSMILVRVDPAAKQVTMLSIPRDLWVPLSVGGTAKIDGAYSYGGAGA